MARKSSGNSNSATVHDQTLVRGEGGELHQVAEGTTDILTTAQGGPVADDQTAQDRSPRANSH
jgi:catalase